MIYAATIATIGVAAIGRFAPGLATDATPSPSGTLAGAQGAVVGSEKGQTPETVRGAVMGAAKGQDQAGGQRAVTDPTGTSAGTKAGDPGRITEYGAPADPGSVASVYEASAVTSVRVLSALA